MNCKEAAQRLGVSKATVSKLVTSGQLAATRIDGRYDVSEEAVAKYDAERWHLDGRTRFDSRRDVTPRV